MVYLASCSGFVSIKTMAVHENISPDFLEKIFAEFKKANLVRVKRGVEGGYTLAKAPSKISVGDIVRPLEEKMALALCLEKGVNCPRERKCLTKNVWAKIQNEINKTLDGINLFDLINEKR